MAKSCILSELTFKPQATASAILIPLNVAVHEINEKCIEVPGQVLMLLTQLIFQSASTPKHGKLQSTSTSQSTVVLAVNGVVNWQSCEYPTKITCKAVVCRWL